MYNRDLRILFVTGNCPYAPSYGSQLRVFNIARLLSRIGKVSFVIVSSCGKNEASPDKTEREFEIKHNVHLTAAHRRNAIERIRHELAPSFLGTEGFEASKADREAMLRMINEHDLIWVHRIETANRFRIYRWPHTVLDIDDIPSRLFASKAKAASGIIRTMMDYRRSIIWWRRERILERRFDVIAVTNEEDRRYLGGDRVIQVIPNGFNPPTEGPCRALTMPPRIGFIGTLKWLPNQEGVEWFIRHVWPRIKSEFPTVHLRLVGEGSDRYFPEIGADIDGLGWIADPSAEIASWSAMIVPVMVGGGTRIKIAEAFSRKCPVVSTTLGAFGYEVCNGEDLLLADKAEDFASACVLLVKNMELGLKLSENAWKKYLERWTWNSIGVSVSKALEECLIRSNCEYSQSDTIAGH